MEAVSLSQLEAHDAHPLRQGIRARYLCPLSAECREKPRDSAHRSLAVENISGVYYCHRCGAKGRLQEFWQQPEGVKPFKKKARPRPTIVATPIKKEKTADIETLREKMAGYAQEFFTSPAEDYLSGRMIPREISRTAGCGYAPAWEHWEKKASEWTLSGTDRRVVFPVRDAQGELVAVHTRAIDDDVHLNSSKITKGNKSQGVFYTTHDAFSAPVIAVCEGPVDALTLGACGVPAVAMIGTSAPDWLAHKLKDKAVLLATDADKAGDDAALKLRMNLRTSTKNIFRLRPLAAKDWAEELELAGTEALSEYLQPFSPDSDDVTRVNAAWQFAEQGFYEEAEFIARLIQDDELKKSIFSLVHREHLKAA
jgi:DNA primase